MLAGAYTWDPSLSTEGPLTIVMSTKEKVAHVLRGGKEIGRVHVEVGPNAPSGTTAYLLLDGTTARRASSCRASPRCAGRSLATPSIPTASPRRPDSFGEGLTVPPAFAEKVYPLLAPGATIVVTGEALSADDRVTPLTVITGDEAGSIADASEDPE
jgi:hypothetical protein